MSNPDLSLSPEGHPVVYEICLGTMSLGWGYTPREAIRAFWRTAWCTALGGVGKSPPELRWIERECALLCMQQQPTNWSRAARARWERLSDPHSTGTEEAG